MLLNTVKLLLLRKRLNDIERDRLANEIFNLFIDVMEMNEYERYDIIKLYNNELDSIKKNYLINKLAMKYKKDPIENRKKIALYLSIVKMYMDILRSD